MSPSRTIALLVGLLLAAGCAERSDDPARLYNARTLRANALAGLPTDELDTRALITLRGQPLPLLSPPYAPVAQLQATGLDGLEVSPTFVEGQPGSYVTTEVWYAWGPIWVQPLYVLVTAWDAQSPLSHLLPGARPIFAVGEDSSFYSPYWQVTFAVAPAGTAPDRFRSTKDVLDAQLELHPGPVKDCPLVPDDVGVGGEDGLPIERPLDQGPVGPVKRVSGWAEGRPVTALDFGSDRFLIDQGGVVEETALFHFTTRDASGNRQEVGLPSVGGVGPFGSGRAPDAPGGVPRFGTLWRLYYADVPATAGVFVRAGEEDLRARVVAAGVQAPAPSDDISHLPGVAAYELRVAQDPSCFTDPARFPAGCRWLDSQAAVEGSLGRSALERTELVLTCTLTSYLGQPVPNP